MQNITTSFGNAKFDDYAFFSRLGLFRYKHNADAGSLPKLLWDLIVDRQLNN